IFNGIGGGNSPFFVSIISFAVAFVFSYLISLVVPGKKKDIKGLTIFDKNEQSNYISKIHVREK
ncbi:Na+/proline symporter, partial [Enterobacter mori]